jgi:hypothetical protein
VARITGALAAAILLSAAVAKAQIPISVGDIRVVEGRSGWWSINIPVSPAGPPPATITVDYTILSGSALPGSDYTAVPASGTLTFPALSIAPQYIPGVQINGDTLGEWSPTLQQDEVFFVQLANASAGGVIDKGRGTVTLIDDDHPTVNEKPGVQFLAAVSGGTAATGQTRLQWRVPAAQVQPIDVAIRWNTGPSCSFPSSTTAGAGTTTGGVVAAAGAVQTWNQIPSPTLNLQYCYSVFTIYGAGPTTEIAQVKATSFNATGTVAWRYCSGATSVVPPTVGADAIYTVDNAGVVHAMQRGPAGGAWPTGWNPLSLGKPAQSRSPVSTDEGRADARRLASFRRHRWRRRARGGRQVRPADLVAQRSLRDRVAEQRRSAGGACGTLQELRRQQRHDSCGYEQWTRHLLRPRP